MPRRRGAKRIQQRLATVPRAILRRAVGKRARHETLHAALARGAVFGHSTRRIARRVHVVLRGAHGLETLLHKGADGTAAATTITTTAVTAVTTCLMAARRHLQLKRSMQPRETRSARTRHTLASAQQLCARIRPRAVRVRPLIGRRNGRGRGTRIGASAAKRRARPGRIAARIRARVRAARMRVGRPAAAVRQSQQHGRVIAQLVLGRAPLTGGVAEGKRRRQRRRWRRRG